ncbi:unnamed protein product, partial [Phaeothamnion confervicola]
MWGMGAGLTDEDRLDRSQTGAVMRRSLEFAKPYRSAVWKAMVFVTLSTLCTVAGPLLVRIASDHGLSENNASVLNTVIVIYVVIVV